MKSLQASLKESDEALRRVIAVIWGLDVTTLDDDEMIPALHDAMLEPERALRVWDSLDDEQRGALQTLISSGSGSGRMSLPMYERMYGEVRKMGAGAIEREKPHQNPATTAEALFYRGLIYEGFEQAQTGARPVVYIPAELVEALPTHKTAYDGLEESVPATDNAAPSEIEAVDSELIDEIVPADTSIVDDMTTLLAYLQINGGTVENGDLIEQDQTAIVAHCLHDTQDRMKFIFRLAISAKLIDVNEDHAHPRRAEARRWLEAKRSAQLKQLADTWRKTASFRDLWHVSGLHPEPTGWTYDPVLARGAVINFIRAHTPLGGWWSLEEFITAVKQIDPDFQRPSGDYESWYIRNDDGEYLKGFESWDAVEGALLEFYIMGPMHWLGMVDLAVDAARLTAYGRAFVTEEPWPNPPEDDEKIVIQDDGALLVSRKVPRIDRFQTMRFTTWVSPATGDGEPYSYKLTEGGMRRASEQGINASHIDAFLKRMAENTPLPPAITTLLDEGAPSTGGEVTIEPLTVLRTTSPETLDYIADTPALRRYLGARLGAMAVVVRPDQIDALRTALDEHGIRSEIVG